ncbi:putative RDD family membrane protein YckC [Dyella sp. SG562]|uniref:hypothetical protein n=1 Tax=Dyella sp. SG562 TaxID=2587017 RepID=UPI00141FB71D|nr:hypothetical protein [Dyella sp. SG562]NII73227.1 putative RDD family membrane protein YckC [Dyella sp. SG562]
MSYLVKEFLKGMLVYAFLLSCVGIVAAFFWLLPIWAIPLACIVFGGVLNAGMAYVQRKREA